MEFLPILLLIIILGGFALFSLQGWAQEADTKLNKIHQELIDAVIKETSNLDSSEYDFTDTVACRVPGEDGILKRFECTSFCSSSTKRSAFIAFGSIGGDIQIDATNINPVVDKVFLGRGDIVDVQISINEERSSVSTGQVGGRTGQALIGTVLFGGVGGQIGASGRRSISMTSKEEISIKSLALEIFTRSNEHPYLFVHFFPDAKSIVDSISLSSEQDNSTRSDMISERREYKQLKKWYSILLGLKEASTVPSSLQPGSDMADQLSRLHDLKEKGVITQQEFEEAKKKTLGLS